MRFFYFFLLISNTLIGQPYHTATIYYLTERYYFKDDFAHYEVTGNVKRITATETHFEKPENKKSTLSSVESYKVTAIVEFTNFQKPERLYSISRTGEKFITDLFVYDTLNRIIEKKEFGRKDFVYEEKYLYDQDHLVELWVKSSKQTNFFLKEKYVFKDSLLIRVENLNNDKDTFSYARCKGGITDEDWIEKLCYEDNKVTKIELFNYVYDANYMGPPTEDMFVWSWSKEFKYQNEKMILTTENWTNYDKFFESKTVYCYKNDNLISKVTTNNKNKRYNPFKKYYYKKGKLYLVTEGYKKNSIYRKLYFDEFGNLIKLNDFQNGKITCMKKFNEKGHLILDKNEKNTTYDVIYDSKGNWTVYSKYENNILIELKERQIEYYDSQ